MLPKMNRKSFYKFLRQSSLIAVGAGMLAASFTDAVKAQAVYLTDVEVRGAEFISEADILQACDIIPNFPYQDYDLAAIEDCLMMTGVFEEVDVRTEDRTLVVEVQELNTRPGRLEASLAYASVDGVIGSLYFERYNLFPQTFGSLRLDFNTEIKRATASLYRNNLPAPGFGIGFDMHLASLNYDDTSYTHEYARLEPYLAWSRNRNTRVEVGLGYRGHRQSDIGAGASALVVKEQTNGISAPYLRFGFNHSSDAVLDDAWDAAGFQFKFDQFFWNLGTNDQLTDSRVAMSSYVPLGNDFRFLVSVSAGYVNGLDGNATRAIDRFFPGPTDLRGFSPRGLGPRHAGDALGGNKYAVASFEVQKKLDTLFKAPVYGGIFVDTGAAWSLDDTLGGVIDDSQRRRSSVGLSLTFNVANTPVSLYVAKPIEKEAGDQEQAFGLSFTARF